MRNFIRAKKTRHVYLMLITTLSLCNITFGYAAGQSSSANDASAQFQNSAINSSTSQSQAVNQSIIQSTPPAAPINDTPSWQSKDKSQYGMWWQDSTAGPNVSPFIDNPPPQQTSLSSCAGMQGQDLNTCVQKAMTFAPASGTSSQGSLAPK